MASCKKKTTPSKRKSASQKHATKLSLAIINATKAIQRPVYDFWKAEAYKELEYNSFKDWAKANQEKFNRSYDSINNDLHTALITVDMCGEENIGKFSTYALLPMKNLTEQDRKTVYEHALSELEVSELKGSHLTRKRVEKYLKELNFSAQKEQEDNEQTNTNTQTPKCPLNSEQLKLRKQFNEALNNKENRHFAKRVCSAISDAIPKKSTLLICRDLLKKHDCKDAVREVRKAIKQLESK
ncbi:hypothetical protein MHM95_09930 [Pseudoalteromonas sp. CnMc7-15]|uniref:hypothetical protein n=1 Tax=unclassified Pseudoalteromonas TaxID=194690 RepID=UPI001EF73B8E|nr:hypothetical protein [Pseudoalteromonas sp. CnMc7-15]MCG7566609.1 hypothetical protein [Pseudoalteromonas sp. CnMc7-15]